LRSPSDKRVAAPFFKPGSPWQQQLATVTAWLAQTDDASALNTLRLHANKGLPCGDDGFVARLGGMIGRSLVPIPRARPRLEQELDKKG
jgi:hypothetical protein